jgi:hypothetical protein
MRHQYVPAVLGPGDGSDHLESLQQADHGNYQFRVEAVALVDLTN